MTDVYAEGPGRRLPSAEECLSKAVHEMTREFIRPAVAKIWVDMAREIREGSVPAQGAAPDRLTLHDIEGIVCTHGRVAVRRKNASPAGWFLHSDDGSNCDLPAPETEHFRRTSARGLRAPAVNLTATPAEAGRGVEVAGRIGAAQETLAMPAVREGEPRCRWCDAEIRDAVIGTIHTLTGKKACVRPLSQAHLGPTYAEPHPGQ